VSARPESPVAVCQIVDVRLITRRLYRDVAIADKAENSVIWVEKTSSGNSVTGFTWARAVLANIPPHRMPIFPKAAGIRRSRQSGYSDLSRSP